MFKEGALVQVKLPREAFENSRYCYYETEGRLTVVSEMFEYDNKIGRITEVLPDRYVEERRYRIDIDGNRWIWDNYTLRTAIINKGRE